MLESLKSSVKRNARVAALYRGMRRKFDRAVNEVRDIRDTYLSLARGAEVTPEGFQFAGGGSMHHRAMLRGEFEPEETRVLRRELERARVFVDVGANIGYYACLARSMGRHVIAIEPLPQNLNHLYFNLRANRWNDVEVHPVGLSDRVGLATLYGASMTGASLIPGWAGSWKRIRRTIPLSTLDIVLGGRFEGEPMLIKIDVEGVEHAVLEGALRTLERRPRPTWMVEICLNEHDPSGLNPHFADTFALFMDRGYQARRAGSEERCIGRGEIEGWVRQERCDSGVINYLFQSAEG
jgi:FkbM family methyltransferase